MHESRITAAAGDEKQDVSALIETLRETGQPSAEPAADVEGTLTDRRGQAILLRRAQDHLRHNEAAKQAAILNALPAHIALLDSQGFIVSVNEAWRCFAGAHVLQNAEARIGTNYLELCGSAGAEGAAVQAQQAGAGLRAVLEGRLPGFSLEYPCHSPTRQRWFMLTATPLAGAQPRGAVVVHADITQHKKSDQQFKGLLEAAPDALVIVNRDAEIVLVNCQAVRLFGWSREELLGRKIEMLVPARVQGQHSDSRSNFLAQPHSRTMGVGPALFGQRKDGSEFPVEISLSPLETDEGPLVISAIRDITERNETQARIKRLNRVYAVLSGINTLIVHVRDRDELFRQACRVAVEAGAFKMAWIGVLDLPALGGKVVAGYGSDQGFMDQLERALCEGGPQDPRPTCRALHLGQVVICNDIATEPSLAAHRDELLSRGYRSSGSFPLRLAGSPVAVLALFAGESDCFDGEEMALLLELASNLSFAMDNLEKGKRLEQLDAQRQRDEHGLWRFSAAMDAIADAILLVDRASMRFVHVNDAACRFVNRTREELLACEPWKLYAASRAELERTYDALITSGTVAPTQELLRQSPDGSTAWLELRRHAQRSADGWTIVTLVRDITERKKADARIVYLNRVQAVLSRINTLIVHARERDELFAQTCLIAVEAGGFRMAWIGIIDPEDKRLVPLASAGVPVRTLTAIKNRFAVSEAVSQGPSLTAQAVREKTCVVSNDSQNDPRLTLPQEHAAAGIHSLAVLPLIVADEAVGVLALYAQELEFFHEEEVKLLTELAGNIAFAIDHIDKQAQLDYLAYYDPLTGLANRSLFLERVVPYMHSAFSGGHQLAVFLLDLERFKNINDSLGRTNGDAILKQVAQWLIRHAGDANLVARVGADHFAMVMPEVRPGGNAERFVEKWLKSLLSHPFRLNDAVFRLSAKVGIALFPDDGTSADTLFRNAEAALKKAKSRGEHYLFYTPAMTEAVADQLTLENQLRQALDNQEFVLHYQPKVSLVSGKLIGAEALIRWHDPSTGLVPPGQFIPILEETGLIHDVGRWALHQAVKDYLRWRAAGLPAVRIAVNVSALQLRHRGFVAEVRHAIGIDPQAAAGLELEITESLIMADVQGCIETLQAIRALGVTVAIDDFGTGFSSLSYLARLPVDTLKIDRSFVIDMTTGPQGLALVSTIVSLAHALNLKVVAEGVETEEQSRLLRVLGCDEMQGYLFSKPVPGESFEAQFLRPPVA